MTRPASRATIVAALAALAGAATGCGGTSHPQEAAARPASAGDAGARVFAKAGCGSCHTLAAAGSTGVIGPNLDQLAPDRATVVRQVTQGGGGMPSFAKRLARAQIAAVASYVSRSTSGVAPSRVIAFRPDGTKLGDCDAADPACYLQAFGNLAYRDGPTVALARFSHMIESTPAVEEVCHPIAHMIGAATLLRFKGNVGKAFAAGSAVCGSGYYHGLLQWKLAGVPAAQIRTVARTVCASVRRQASFFVYYQCVHGLGHGLMLYTRSDLPVALRLCHGLADNFDRESCTGGVFMENQRPSFGGPSKWLRAKDLLYPCDIVSRFDKTYCYLMVTSQILSRNGYDWRKTAAWCRRSSPGFVDLCFQSYGRDASGASRQDPAGIRRICANAGSGQQQCLYGAVRDILNNQPGDPRAKQLCDAVAARDRSECFFGIGTMIGTQYATPAARAAACRSFAAGATLDECVRGATASAAPRS
jgi:mono/diheme cytochrome c family protein